MGTFNIDYELNAIKAKDEKCFSAFIHKPAAPKANLNPFVCLGMHRMRVRFRIDASLGTAGDLSSCFRQEYVRILSKKSESTTSSVPPSTDANVSASVSNAILQRKRDISRFGGSISIKNRKPFGRPAVSSVFRCPLSRNRSVSTLSFPSRSRRRPTAISVPPMWPRRDGNLPRLLGT